MTEASDIEQAAFDRGVISRTLTEHGEHLRQINGSTEKTAVALGGLSAEMQHMGAELKSIVVRLDAEAETRLRMAEALEKAEAQRRDNSERRWSVPMQRIAWVISGVSALVALYFALRG